MSRLGTWEPATTEERLDRMESLAEIRQLPMRYGLHVDSKNYDALVGLFTPDVRVGRDQHGREALADWYRNAIGGLRASVHFVGNHVIAFDSADRAHGVVYCRDELDREGSGKWDIGILQYWDTYVRVDGDWCFERRRFNRLYIGDALTRPEIGQGVAQRSDGLRTNQLPDVFADLERFWNDEL